MVIHAQYYVSITLKDGDTCTRLCINHLKRWWYMHKIMYQFTLKDGDYMHKIMYQSP